MKRRSVLLAAGSAFALAGCAGGPDNSAFDLVEYSAPETVNVSQGWDWSLTVENTESEENTFRTPVEWYLGGGEWAETETVELTVPGGEQATYESHPHGGDAYVDQIRVRPLDVEFEVVPEITDREFGSLHEDGVEKYIAVDGIELLDSVTDDSGDTHTPEDGKQFCVATIRLENQFANQMEPPPETDFTVRSAETSDGRYTFHATASNRWEGRILRAIGDPYTPSGTLGPGEREQGLVLFEIPEDVSAEEVTVDAVTENIGARWGASPPFELAYSRSLPE